MRVQRLCVACAVIAFVGGCATSRSRVADSAIAAGEVVSGSVVLIDPDIELSQVSAGGVPQPRADWTERARTELPAALERELAGRGALAFASFEVPDDLPAAARMRQLVHLHRAVGGSIVVHGSGNGSGRLPSKGRTFDWTLGRGVSVLREATRADYALFVTIRDSYTSSGRAALMVVGALVGVGMSGGVQTGFASLVDLRDGRVVWFNTLVDPGGDLRDAPGADRTARRLLEGMPLQ